MSEQKTRVALIGLDHWYSALPFAEQVAGSDTAELVAICDRDLERARPIAERLGVSKVTSDPQDVLGDASIQAIASFISTDQNPSVCIEAARNDKHILSVKPFARTLDEATQVVRAVKEAGVVFLPAEAQQRLSGQNQRLNELVSGGKLGKVLTANFSMWGGLPRAWPGAGDNEHGWWTEANRVPGGGWIDHSIYYIDALRWMLGSEISKVSGHAANFRYPDLKPLEDYGVATVWFENGTIATIEVTWHSSKGGSRTNMSMVGTDGSLAMDSLSGRMSLSGKLTEFPGWVHVSPTVSHAEGAGDFLAAVRGDEKPLATIEDAWHNLAACIAFYESAKNDGAAVTPAPVPSA